ncbi:MAG: 4'-phosphopantetheinyl transferase family protein [Leptolyngbyaceae cyanobacterium]
MARTLENPTDHNAWRSAPPDCHQTLGQTTLDLWRISLKQPIQLDVLSKDERLRFDRYRFADDRRKFAAARHSLRQILARYSQQSPAALVFDYGPYGKPFLQGDNALQFNLSHSGEYALCGVAQQTVGLDIELLRPMDRLDGLVKRCLASSEQIAITQAASEQKSALFLKYWTCKEAYLKATGQGISESLSAIEVSLTSCPRLKVADQRWQLQVFTPCDGYTGAVVTTPEISCIRRWAYVVS